MRSTHRDPKTVTRYDHGRENLDLLRRLGNKWAEVKDEILPPLYPGMFWEDPQAATRLAKIISVPSHSAYHFRASAPWNADESEIGNLRLFQRRPARSDAQRV
jgi:hypothetical protein